jgi:hypothetical protein
MSGEPMTKRNQNPMIPGMQKPIDTLASTSRSVASPSNTDEKGATVEGQMKGGIFAALRRSPLVGADLNLARTRTDSRVTDL